jgi:hypothetical protein
MANKNMIGNQRLTFTNIKRLQEEEKSMQYTCSFKKRLFKQRDIINKVQNKAYDQSRIGGCRGVDDLVKKRK